MSGGYSPKVANPWLSNNIPQMRSNTNQLPFFFGGSQTPISLGLPVGSFSGSGFSKVAPSPTRPVLTDFTAKRGDIVYHQGGKKARTIYRPL